MTQVMQQGGGDQRFSVPRRNGSSETIGAGELPQVQQRVTVYPQRMFKSRVICRRIHHGNQAKLTDSGKPAEFDGIDHLANPRGERHVNFGWQSDQSRTRFESSDFRYVEDGIHDCPFKTQRVPR